MIRPAEEGKLEVSYRWFCTCNDAGEIKKMYIRPKFRGEKLGNLLIEEVIDVSKGNGFSKLYLDTVHFMSSAISLYKKFGLKETSSYPESVIPREL